jgi:CRISPR-associated endonuclease Cas3-HD
MCDKWPLAYKDEGVEEPLLDHLLVTACLTRCLFKDRAVVLVKRANVIDVDLVDHALYLLGFLHDIGKMSYYYRRHHCREGRISFPFHEYVSALLVYRAGDRLMNVDERLGMLLKIVAKAIARHHAAMVERDLTSVLGDERAAKIIGGAIKDLDLDLLKGLVAQGLVGEFPRYLASSIVDAHEDLVKASIPQQLENLRGARDRWLVAGLAGFLIVADNIVASKIRGSTDGHTPLYIKMWVEELGGRVEECNLRCSRVPGHG